MASADLRALIAALEPPPEGGEYTFTTALVPGQTSLRVGRSKASIAVLVPSGEAAPLRAPIELKNLTVRFSTLCRLREGGVTSEGNFTLVRCVSEDPMLQSVFIDAVQAYLIHSSSSANGSIANFVTELVELFMSLSENGTSSTVGVWGELFLIASSDDPDLLLAAWHNLPQERHDFGAKNERLEVKTSTRGRRHTFALDQLDTSSGTDLWIASIVTEPSAAGPSVYELITLIARRSKDASAGSVLVRKAAQALGSDTTHWRSARFDFAAARSSLLFLPAHAIPRPTCPSDRIVDVRFTVQLDGYSHEEATDKEFGPLRAAASSEAKGLAW